VTAPAASYNYIKQPNKVALVGVPLSRGQPLLGVERGPLVIRERGLATKLESDGWVVDDLGDLNFKVIECSEEERAGKKKYAAMIGAANKLLCDTNAEQARQGKFVLTLGGDHSLGIGSVAGMLMARPETAVIWVDAHADLNTPRTSISGNIHGMSAAFLMNLEKTRDLSGFEWLHEVPTLLANRLVYVGLRDLDPSEKVFIRELGIRAFTMQDVDRHGIGQVMDKAIEHLTMRKNRPLHLSLDIDSVDPEFAPSTGTRVRGGLSYREAYFIAERLAETGMLTSMDMVEVNPSLGDDAKSTIDMAVGLISSALGNRIL